MLEHIPISLQGSDGEPHDDACVCQYRDSFALFVFDYADTRPGSESFLLVAYGWPEEIQQTS